MNQEYEGSRLPYNERKVLIPVEILQNVWIGMIVVLIPGITIGDGVIVRRSPDANQDVPPLSVAGNQPMWLLIERDSSHYETLDQRGAYSGMSGYERKRQ